MIAATSYRTFNRMTDPKGTCNAEVFFIPYVLV